MNELTEKKDLSVLAAEIKVLRRQGELAALSYGIEIGRKLMEAKAVVPHGQWGKWLETEVNYSQSQAELYMNAYKGYGDQQQSLFGEAAPQVIEELGFTKAVKLLAIPEPEREKFAVENQVKDMSTRELDAAIKEYKQQAEDSRKAFLDEKGRNEQLEKRLSEMGQAAEKAGNEVERLRQAVKELENRPVEVAVQAPTEEMMAQIRADAEKEFRKEKDKLTKQLEKAEKAQKSAETDLEKAKKAVEKAKAEAQEENKNAVAAKAAAEARAAELEKQLATASPLTTEFKVYFAEIQETANRLRGILLKADETQKVKLKAALEAFMRQQLNLLGKEG